MKYYQITTLSTAPNAGGCYQFKICHGESYGDILHDLILNDPNHVIMFVLELSEQDYLKILSSIKKKETEG